MFQNFTLFSRQNHVISGPSPHWTPKVRIFCTCELNTGFTSVLRWTHHNPIKLTALISFYKQLTRPRYSLDETRYSFSYPFSFDSSIRIKWWDIEGPNTHIQVYRVQRWWNDPEDKEYLLVEKTVSLGTIHDYGADFFGTVMRSLTMADAEKMSIFFGELINRDKYAPSPEFQIGQRVSTVIGPNVKTLRTGHVISRFYHYKDETNMYLLIVDGKVRRKRYLPGDLRPA